MRTLMLNFAAAAFLALALTLAPATADAQDGRKYGFVSISKVITESEEGRTEAGELESLGAEKEQELNARREELQDLIEQYQEGVSAGQPDEELRGRIEKMKRELERDVRQAQSDVDTSRKDRIQAIGAKVIEIVRRFGEENGYDAIFRTDGGQVVYADPGADITDEIIKAYDEAHPVD